MYCKILQYIYFILISVVALSETHDVSQIGANSILKSALKTNKKKKALGAC